MNFSMLERRKDARTQAFVPVHLQQEVSGLNCPAHLIDLSPSGAGFLTTTFNAPELGQYVEVEFEPIDVEGKADGCIRRERGVVVNIRPAQKGVVRVGVHFVHKPELNIGWFDPRDVVNYHRSKKPIINTTSRWDMSRYEKAASKSTYAIQ